MGTGDKAEPRPSTPRACGDIKPFTVVSAGFCSGAGTPKQARVRFVPARLGTIAGRRFTILLDEGRCSACSGFGPIAFDLDLMTMLPRHRRSWREPRRSRE